MSNKNLFKTNQRHIKEEYPDMSFFIFKNTIVIYLICVVSLEKY